MKPCIACKTQKPLSEFYRHPKMADGHLGKCKDCVKEYTRHRRQVSDAARAYDRARSGRPNRVALRAAVTREWRESNPQGYAAHTAVGNAMRDGRLQKLTCAVCGDATVHAHHPDYSRPLDVVWLCPLHHARHHAQEGSNHAAA